MLHDRKAVVLNDIHFGLKKSSDTFFDHQERFFREILFPYIDHNKIPELFILGDFFHERKLLHVKAIHRMRKAFLEPLRDRGIQTTLILGNHDILHSDTSEINAPKEILGFFKDTIKIITHPTTTHNGKLVWLPWVNRSNRDESIEFLKKHAHPSNILLAHLELSGFEFMPGIIAQPSEENHELDTSILSKFQLVVSGHYHHKSSRDNIHYLGAQYQMNWSDYDCKKYFHELNIDTGELKAIENPFSLYTKFHYNSSMDISSIQKVSLKNQHIKLIVQDPIENYQHFDSIVATIESCSPYSFKIEDYSTLNLHEANHDALSNSEDGYVVSARDFALQYIDSIATSNEDIIKDGERFKKLFIECYAEAEAMEGVVAS